MDETKPRWQNPFIQKISDHKGTIFTCKRETPETLKFSLNQIIPLYSKLILEICSGSGGHLIELANRNPDSLCLGVELRFKRIVRTAQKAEQLGLKNLKLLQVDATTLNQVFENKSCDKIFINFPDPWDGKSRWEDKYLLSKKYLETLNSLLKHGGSFHHKTDNQRRFEETHDFIKQLSDLYEISEFSRDLHRSEYNSSNITTEFERLFTSQKKPVFYLKALKRA